MNELQRTEQLLDDARAELPRLKGEQQRALAMLARSPNDDGARTAARQAGHAVADAENMIAALEAQLAEDRAYFNSPARKKRKATAAAAFKAVCGEMQATETLAGELDDATRAFCDALLRYRDKRREIVEAVKDMGRSAVDRLPHDTYRADVVARERIEDFLGHVAWAEHMALTVLLSKLEPVLREFNGAASRVVFNYTSTGETFREADAAANQRAMRGLRNQLRHHGVTDV